MSITNLQFNDQTFVSGSNYKIKLDDGKEIKARVFALIASEAGEEPAAIVRPWISARQPWDLHGKKGKEPAPNQVVLSNVPVRVSLTQFLEATDALSTRENTRRSNFLFIAKVLFFTPFTES